MVSVKNSCESAQNVKSQKYEYKDKISQGKEDSYLKRTGNQLLLGNYTDDVTLLGTSGQVALGLFGVDLITDIRDLSADLVNWKWSWGHVGQTSIDVLGLIPVIGLVKYIDEVGVLLKHSDETGDALKNTGKAGSGACFIAGTSILTKNGYKSIEDIEVGDEVYSENTETGEKGYKKVVQTFQKEVDTIVHLSIGEEEIDTTENHPFYVEGKGFVHAGELKEGDKVVTASGDILTVDKVEIEKTEQKTKVYNFEVEDWHTYFVSEEEILVHNDCRAPIPEGATDVTKKVSTNYKETFFEKHPDLRGEVVVHHSVEQQVLKKYPDIFTKEEIHAYESLRGIPNEVNSEIHLSKIRIEWNKFYKDIAKGKIKPTKENFLNKAKEIDGKFGDKFNPKIE